MSILSTRSWTYLKQYGGVFYEEFSAAPTDIVHLRVQFQKVKASVAKSLSEAELIPRSGDGKIEHPLFAINKEFSEAWLIPFMKAKGGKESFELDCELLAEKPLGFILNKAFVADKKEYPEFNDQVYIHIHKYMYIYLYIHIYTYIYVYIYIHT